LNDSSFVVAARHFAGRMMENQNDPKEQIKIGYKQLLMRDISPKKLDVLLRLYSKVLNEYEKNTEAATTLTADEKGSPQFAAMTVVANAMLNLDEVLTKE
jgi:hypothetical protein